MDMGNKIKEIRNEHGMSDSLNMIKNVIYIDTNALYYAAEISTNNDIDLKKIQELICTERIALSSTSLYEFIMKYKNDIDTVRKLGRYMEENNIYVVFNKYFKMTDSFNINLKCISQENFEKLIEEVKTIKIKTESRFAAIVFCMCIFSGLHFISVKDGEVSSFAIEISQIVVNFVASIMPSVFENCFEEGYETNNCEKYIKNKFSQLLEYLFKVLIPFVEKAADAEGEIEVKVFLDDHDWEGLSNQLNKKISKATNSTIYLKKLAIKYWKAENDDHLALFFENFSKAYNKFPEQTLREYVEEIMRKCCLEGGAFWKNDILDAVILCHVDEENRLVTFDEGVKQHMKKYHEKRVSYNESLKLIESLYV